MIVEFYVTLDIKGWKLQNDKFELAIISPIINSGYSRFGQFNRLKFYSFRKVFISVILESVALLQYFIASFPYLQKNFIINMSSKRFKQKELIQLQMSH